MTARKILVAYASRSGSTAEVAAAVGKILAEHGTQVDVRPMQEISDLTPYSAVVAGSAIRQGHWLPEAMQFVLKHRATLAQKPFAMFTLCMTLAMKNTANHKVVKDWVQPVRALVNPVSEGYFAGVLDISRVETFRHRLMFRISVMMGVWKAGDNRAWEQIRAWAATLPAKLGGQQR